MSFYNSTSVQYLGYMASEKGITIDLVKTRRVRNWPMPTNYKTLCQFLGFASFYFPEIACIDRKDEILAMDKTV